MKNQLNKTLLLLLVLLCLCVYGCRKPHQTEYNACLPGHVLIVPLREVNHPYSYLLIRTEDKDTSYIKYFGHNAAHFNKYGFMMSSAYLEFGYLKFELIDCAQYSFIKKYVLSHNTQRNNTTTDAFNSVKIFLEDKCDTISYIIEKTDIGYFSNLIDTLIKFENKNLLKRLGYYKAMQEKDPNDKYLDPRVKK